MGQNIGTCVTPLIASIGASKNAKRTAVVHLSFNVIGTIVFLIGTYTIQALIGFPFWLDPIDKGGIANFHTLFNVVVTLLFLPFTKQLEKLACAIVKDSPEDMDSDDVALRAGRTLYAVPRPGHPAREEDHCKDGLFGQGEFCLRHGPNAPLRLQKGGADQ